MMQATIVPNSRRAAYAIRDAVEFLQFGHAAQHKLQAALPKQQATVPARDPMMQPILAGWVYFSYMVLLFLKPHHSSVKKIC